MPLRGITNDENTLVGAGLLEGHVPLKESVPVHLPWGDRIPLHYVPGTVEGRLYRWSYFRRRSA